jgi:hypothetical protein
MCPSFPLARGIEDTIQDMPEGYRPNLKKMPCVAFHVDFNDGGDIRIKAAVRELKDNNPFMGLLSISTPQHVLLVPIPLLMRGRPEVRETNTVYYHGFNEPAETYIGITQNRWAERFAQHRYSANSGSPYLFHRKMRSNEGPMVHRVIASGLSRDAAMAMEESLVEDTLYPRGLNMIPGGYAGLKYLHSLGLRKTTAWDKDIVVERLPRLETIDGRPNPLCAARWQTDQNFVNKVICGHGARLTVEHVREARLMSDKGLTGFAIAASLCRSEDQIMRLLRGKTYTRVA